MLDEFLDRRGSFCARKADKFIDEKVKKLINLLESDFDVDKYGYFTMQEKMKMMT